ncbi:MAG: 50S ribosome-binding GTPase [Bowdeniella nasicola]|nr:50S ribosome-binding GTPase [Bowdeniella nasicola]
MTNVRESAAHLERALDLAEERFNPDAIEYGREVLSTVRERGELSTSTTVAALFGATGSGKSSLFNALSGTNEARVAHTRPTTTEALAIGARLDPETSALLDWLEVSERREDDTFVSDLLLIDLPDVDSVERHHRALAEKMARVVDVLVWVLDPQKYADAVIHHDFLSPLARHAEVTVIVLNQVDRIDAGEVGGVIADVARLAEADGLTDVTIHPTSAVTGEGIVELRAVLRDVAARQSAVRAKLRAEIDHAADRLLRDCAEPTTSGASADAVIDAAADAAGSRVLADAVARSYQRASTSRVGWPFLRWVARLRPDPLARLHLATGAGRRVERAEITGATSLPEPTPIQAARLRASAHDYVYRATSHLPDHWRLEVERDTEARIPALTDSLDTALARLSLPLSHPRWWPVAALIQMLAAIVVAVGVAWLGLAAAARFLYIDVPVPLWRGFPVPTLILLAGLLIGLALAGVGRLVARVGARRRAASTRALVRAAVDRQVREQLIDPIRAQTEDYALFLDAAKRARSR